MNKSIFVLTIVAVIAAVMIASVTVTNADVNATHKKGHDEPPACDNSNGQAPDKNKHCDRHDHDDGDDDGHEDSPGEDEESDPKQTPDINPVN